MLRTLLDRALQDDDVERLANAAAGAPQRAFASSSLRPFLIAALLELKSRLMLPVDDEEGLDLEPSEAAEELLARMLEYHRYRQAAEHLKERLAAEHGYRYRSAPLPRELRRVSIEAAERAYEPELLARAIGELIDSSPSLMSDSSSPTI